MVYTHLATKDSPFELLLNPTFPHARILKVSLTQFHEDFYENKFIFETRGLKEVTSKEIAASNQNMEKLREDLNEILECADGTEIFVVRMDSHVNTQIEIQYTFKNSSKGESFVAR